MRSTRWSKSQSGGLWLPQPTRRTVLSGAVSGVALLLGCGSEKPAKNDGGGAGHDGGAGGSGGIDATVDGQGDAGPDLAFDAGQDLAFDAGQDLAPDAIKEDLVRDAREDLAYDVHAETASLECTERAQQIVGPYPAPGVQLERSDIRSDPGDDGLVKPGVPLTVVLRVGSKGDAGCRPLHGAVVNAWQCDASGQYSSYELLGTSMNKFLRGYQVTDASGVVEFQTIYPGSYPGRTVHVHFAVRAIESSSVIFPDDAFVGQVYFPDAVTDEVLMQAPYSSASRTLNAQDGYYSADMLASVSRLGDGWLAELELAV
jgi:protocatechuate 3,4-dioxygenase beta subunit